MRKLLTTALLSAAATFAVPAVAAPTIIYNPGSAALPGYVQSPTVFQTFSGGTDGAQYTPTGALLGPFGAVETVTPPAGSGCNTGNAFDASLCTFSGTTPSVTVDPANADGLYLNVTGTGASYTVVFTTPVQFFSFVFGSLDTYNKLVLTDALGGVFEYAGAAIVGQAVSFPNGLNSNEGGRVSYDFGGAAGLRSATFTSSQSAFEIDSLAAAVPEPASWAMMIFGFGAVGGALRSNRRRKSVLAAA
ncbi:PEP-CTERM protein-sorting domain-containing protein [Sphingomonas guangdongensis]|uniref:PEP-CTERM protein-sorting domain-containing protein n=1 Tax=Sphingomonas guangdongensis TaxID=1141890 RepID=A0A285QHT0_9SPHN|nr:PEPxxWA-CTERM sorting domain-containing protein [Sphingomonas guangdongensis]SOB81068.1 PEP-CTERM protein-sorting domain-containing protein [Sphingomonas guangdongensis]